MISGENLRQSGQDFLRSNKYGGHESKFCSGDNANGEGISYNNHKTIVNINHPIIYQAFVIKNNVFFNSSYLSLSLVLNCALYGIVSLNKLMACIPQEELFYTQKWLFI